MAQDSQLDIPIYVVNMPSSADRREAVSAQCRAMGITPTFVQAVVGRELPKETLAQVVNQEAFMAQFGRAMGAGEIGCALSHIGIYRTMTTHAVPYAVVLEDDVVLGTDFVRVVKDCLDFAKRYPAWDIMLLGHYYQDVPQSIKSPLSVWGRQSLGDGYVLGRLVHHGYGTHGYLVSLQGATKLFGATQMLDRPIDHYTSDNTQFDIWALEPTVVNINHAFDSLIEAERALSSSNSPPKWHALIALFRTIRRKIVFFLKSILRTG